MKNARDGSTGSPDRRRGSLRTELLFSLAFLAGAALVLALGAALVPQTVFPARPQQLWPLGLLIVASLAIFLLLGNHLLNRLVFGPLDRTVETAEAIGAGFLDRRVPAGETREFAALSVALNRLTDQLLEKQEGLAENVVSLDRTNRVLHETQRDLVQAEKLASIGQLAAGVAHEIGNPLGALVGYLAVLERRGADPELLAGAQRETRRIDTIVRTLIDYARPETDRLGPVDVNGAIRRVVDLLRGQGGLKGIEVALDLAESLPPVHAGEHRLDQVFVNLLTNAERAMEGEGQLSVRSRRTDGKAAGAPATRRAEDPPELNYAHLRRRPARAPLVGEDCLVHVTVADTGPGIPEERLETVFNPFFSTSAPGEGVGLGLAIVASTIADFGGRVEAASPKGGGAVFTIHLPTQSPSSTS